MAKNKAAAPAPEEPEKNEAVPGQRFEEAKNLLREAADQEREGRERIGTLLAEFREDPQIGAMGVNALIRWLHEAYHLPASLYRVEYRVALGPDRGGLPREITHTHIADSILAVMAPEPAQEMASGKKYPIVDAVQRRLVRKSVFEFTRQECADYIRPTGVLPASGREDEPPRRSVRASSVSFDSEKNAIIVVVNSARLNVLVDPKQMQSIMAAADAA